MKILPIHNTNTKNTQFKAKLPKKDVAEFLREIQYNDIDTVPKLYTMLDFIKRQKGKLASIEHLGVWHRILLDGKSINDRPHFLTAFHALQNGTVEQTNSKLNASGIKKMSEDEFENAFYKNSNKTVKDIEKLFEE